MRYAVRVTLTKTQLERCAALARLQAEQLRVCFVDARRSGDVTLLIDELELRVGSLLETLDLPFGLRVEQVAERLQVSKPTIKKWIDEQFLDQVPDRSPVEITQDSVLRVERPRRTRLVTCQIVYKIWQVS